MNETDLKHLIEATLLAAGRPVTLPQLQALFDERERPTLEQVQQGLDALAADYAERGIEVVEVASGWRIQVRARCVELVSRLWTERPARYSRALLETLALIAYRQPITRSEIEEIRGVTISSTIMRSMQERNWIRVVGHREVPGRPELLGTTREFLDYFGLRSLDQLPTLAELKDIETIGVQLELPSGETPASAAEAEATAAAAEDAAATPGTAAEPGADAARSTPVADSEDAAGNEDAEASGEDEEPDAAAPILVASDAAAEQGHSEVRDPDRDE